MIDREKVIKGLEHYSTDGVCTKCVYYNARCFGKLHADALELLKDEPLKILNIVKFNSYHGYCPNCGERIHYKRTNYCPYCGKRVRWE